MTSSLSYDLAILGGGLAGLTAALEASCAGLAVALFEKAPSLGGRGSTQEADGFYFNQGPHALYRQGHGRQILQKLGIQYSGQRASYAGSWVLFNHNQYPMPGTGEAIQNAAFLSDTAKAEVLALQTQLLQGYPTRQWDQRSAREWLGTQLQTSEARHLFEGQLRLATYCAEMERLSAGAALDQMIVAAQDGVDYLDGGWQTLVQALEAAALRAGVTILTRASVQQLSFATERAAIHLANGDRYHAGAVISTLPPAAIAKLTGPLRAPSLHHWAQTLVPVHAACLDVALRDLPNQDHQFAIGLDQPLYYSVHTRSAKLAPQGMALIQLAQYLKADDPTDSPTLRGTLESLMDRFQPGWRDLVLHQRFLPRMIVTHAIYSTQGRPPVTVREIPNLFLAGDWVGSEGMLVDASLTSAQRAVQHTLERLKKPSQARLSTAPLLQS